LHQAIVPPTARARRTCADHGRGYRRGHGPAYPKLRSAKNLRSWLLTIRRAVLLKYVVDLATLRLVTTRREI
jgi:hypothetical protein